MAGADQLTDAQIEEFREAFNLFDKNQNGTVRKDDIPNIFRSLGHNPKDNDITRLTKETEIEIAENKHQDEDDLDSIDFPEFLAIASKRQKESLRNKEDLKEAFVVFDREHTGFLHKDDLRAVLSKYGSGLAPSEVEAIIQKAHFDDQERLCFEDFYKLICNDN